VGIIITIFLLGLLPGSLLGIRIKEKTKTGLVVSELTIIIMLLVCFMGLEHMKKGLSVYAFLIYPLFFSFICGFQFPVIAKIIGEGKSPAASCFAADLVGASIGTILIGIILIPIYGVKWAILGIIMFKISSTFVASSLSRG
jgi:hypothetical protein